VRAGGRWGLMHMRGDVHEVMRPCAARGRVTNTLSAIISSRFACNRRELGHHIDGQRWASLDPLAHLGIDTYVVCPSRTWLSHTLCSSGKADRSQKGSV
jgi:hypothetical protein